MSRLTERFGQNATTKEPCYIPAGIGKQEGNPLNEIVNKLGRLEDLADEGRLIELPCKLGDKVYCLNYTRWKEDGKYKYKELWVRESFLRLEHIPYFGKTVFLTKAEAEQKLAEMKGGGVDE